jgi:hypothetical protein
MFPTGTQGKGILMTEITWTKITRDQLLDGNVIYPSQDDEGNGPGSLFTNNETNPVIPVL